MTTHILDELRNPGRPSVLFCGAGLSVGAVPAAAKSYRFKHSSAVAKERIQSREKKKRAQPGEEEPF